MQAFQAHLIEPFTPLANDPARLRHLPGYRGHAATFRQQQDDSCSQHVSMGHPLASGSGCKLCSLFQRELDMV